MDREIYQKQYDFELEQRNAIASSTNTPVVSITVIGGALSSMVLSFHYSNGLITYGFIAFVMLSGISSIAALVYIFKSIIGYTYQKIPTPADLYKHYNELVKWHKKNGTKEAQVMNEVKKDFNKYLESRLSEAAENNGNNNIKRGNYIHDATVSIAIALAFLVVAAPFYIYSKAATSANIYKIEVVKPVTLTSEVSKMAEKNSSSNSAGTETHGSAPAQQPTAPAQTQQKPSGPPNTTFKGGVISPQGKTMVTPTDGGSSSGAGGSEE